jgi:hypothetical protein
VPDFVAVKKFYKDLGFKLVWEKKPNERKGYMVMRRGDSIINFYCGNNMFMSKRILNFFQKILKEVMLLRLLYQ